MKCDLQTVRKIYFHWEKEKFIWMYDLTEDEFANNCNEILTQTKIESNIHLSFDLTEVWMSLIDLVRTLSESHNLSIAHITEMFFSEGEPKLSNCLSEDYFVKVMYEMSQRNLVERRPIRDLQIAWFIFSIDDSFSFTLTKSQFEERLQELFDPK